METIYWVLIAIMIIIGFIGLVFPIIPSVLFIFGGILLYGFLFTFEQFNWIFWVIQILLVILLFTADYVANMFGIKKYGGSKAGIWGSTIGILAGPFIIPAFGIIIGPFIGAILAEMIVHKKDLVTASKIGFGSVIGFISSVVTKALIQLFMVGYFLLVVLL
ncbi:DUF456 domain-containing protein [Peribacillus cavernae]|uniref:DUF456 domain-containing protein n=1 Tax=Peribacillus cavernae TaxID=1674310 RepID=A0A433HJ20_9BACI|nr:DUF456 domain-containing protein [Peribacillus cavernae]MDQ0218297.1 uncharacterized protein YqgC (DUF456 family) [Peribacillus cavernae]RUQ28421.1 DUF456 domain-containing protein [Peribacillus cavernae]